MSTVSADASSVASASTGASTGAEPSNEVLEGSEAVEHDRSVQAMLEVLRAAFAKVDWPGIRELHENERFLIKMSQANPGLGGSYEKEAGLIYWFQS